MRLVRCVLVVGLCYSLVLQTWLVQAAGIVAATADTQIVLCHGNGSQDSPAEDGDSSRTRCHFCWLPVPGVAPLPDAELGFGTRIAIAASGYFFLSNTIVVTRPPPRGASRAPPHLA
jgi:hypothetical protein